MGWPTAHSLTHQRPLHWTTDLQRWAAEPVRLLARWRSGEKLDEAIDATAVSRLPDCDATIEWGVGVTVVKGPLGAQTARTRLGQSMESNGFRRGHPVAGHPAKSRGPGRRVSSRLVL